MRMNKDNSPIAYQKVAGVTITFLLLLLAAPSPCRAQLTKLPSETDRLADVGAAPVTISDAKPEHEASSALPDAQTTSAASSPTSDNDDQWHVTVLPYLWFPGMHGTVGAKGYDASVHASAADILSHFRFGLASGLEFRRNRLVVPLDLMWVRLAGDKSLPFPGVEATSANIKIAEVLLTPEIGYRVLDQEKFKIDAVTGFRYWHLGQSLSFSPGTLGLNPSVSVNWVDPIVGGRIQLAPSPKVTVNLLGDVGGWGTGSQLEYQWVALLGYQIKPKWALQLGYRYLDVDYRSGGTLFDVAMPGVFFGATYKFK